MTPDHSLRMYLRNEVRFLCQLQIQGYTDDHPEMSELKQQINQLKQRVVKVLLESAQRTNIIDPLSEIRSLIQESITLKLIWKPTKHAKKD